MYDKLCPRFSLNKRECLSRAFWSPTEEKARPNSTTSVSRQGSLCSVRVQRDGVRRGDKPLFPAIQKSKGSGAAGGRAFATESPEIDYTKGRAGGKAEKEDELAVSPQL